MSSSSFRDESKNATFLSQTRHVVSLRFPEKRGQHRGREAAGETENRLQLAFREKGRKSGVQLTVISLLFVTPYLFC